MIIAEPARDNNTGPQHVRQLPDYLCYVAFARPTRIGFYTIKRNVNLRERLVILSAKALSHVNRSQERLRHTLHVSIYYSTYYSTY